MKYKLEPVERKEVLILPSGDSVAIEWTRLRLVYVFDYGEEANGTEDWGN